MSECSGVRDPLFHVKRCRCQEAGGWMMRVDVHGEGGSKHSPSGRVLTQSEIRALVAACLTALSSAVSSVATLRPDQSPPQYCNQRSRTEGFRRYSTSMSGLGSGLGSDLGGCSRLDEKGKTLGLPFTVPHLRVSVGTLDVPGWET